MSESAPGTREYNTPQYLIAADTLLEAGDLAGVERTANGNKGYLVPARAGADDLPKRISARPIKSAGVPSLPHSLPV